MNRTVQFGNIRASYAVSDLSHSHNMRKKSEARRQSILEAAAQTFRERGFERASMSEICARAGGSKATIYNHFPSKDALFLEVMFAAAEAKFKVSHQFAELASENIADALRNFGEGLLALLYSPAMLSARRLIIAESGRSDLGRECHARGARRGDAFIAGFLQDAMRAGRLRQADPQIAAMHFRGLLESEFLDRFHFNLTDSFSEEEIRAVTDRAVNVFMAAYVPGQS